MKTKQVLVLLVSFAVIFLFSPTLASAQGRPGKMELGLRLYGGAGMLVTPGDFSGAFPGIMDWYDDAFNYWNTQIGYSVDSVGALDPLQYTPFGGLELFFNINPFVGIGFGVGYVTGTKASGPVGVTGTWFGGAVSDEWSITQKVTAIPINMTFYGGLPLGRSIRIVPYLGIGFYMGTVDLEESLYLENQWFGVDLYQDSYWTAKQTTLGFHGGLNFDFYLARNIGLFLGIGGLAASFKDLSGDQEWEASGTIFGFPVSDSDTVSDVHFWVGEERDVWASPQWYRWYYLTQDDPSTWSDTRNIEPGKIPLSQIRVMIGIVIFFMR